MSHHGLDKDKLETLAKVEGAIIVLEREQDGTMSRVEIWGIVEVAEGKELRVIDKFTIEADVPMYRTMRTFTVREAVLISTHPSDFSPQGRCCSRPRRRARGRTTGSVSTRESWRWHRSTS